MRVPIDLNGLGNRVFHRRERNLLKSPSVRTEATGIRAGLEECLDLIQQSNACRSNYGRIPVIARQVQDLRVDLR